MADRISVSTHLVLLQMLQVLSEMAKVETQFIQQLKAMADRIPIRPDFFYFLVLGTFGVKHWVGGGNKNKNDMSKMLQSE